MGNYRDSEDRGPASASSWRRSRRGRSAVPVPTFAVLNDQPIAAGLMATGKEINSIGRDALRAGGKPMLAAIRARTPVRRGHLKRGLRLRIARGQGRIAMLISSSSSRESFAKTRSSGVAARVRGLGGAKDRYRNWYDVPVEYGHRIARSGEGANPFSRKKDADKYSAWGGRVEEHPFMRPGFDETVEQTSRIIEDQVGEKIEVVFERG